jgi:hypothetical protein
MSDLSDTLPAFHDIAKPRCGLLLNGGACMYKPACHESCLFLAEAAKPSSPFSCRPLTDEERSRFKGDADEARADQDEPETFR